MIIHFSCFFIVSIFFPILFQFIMVEK